MREELLSEKEREKHRRRRGGCGGGTLRWGRGRERERKRKVDQKREECLDFESPIDNLFFSFAYSPFMLLYYMVNNVKILALFKTI